MADARADIIIDVDTSVGIAEIKNLQRQIAELNAQLLQSGAQQARAAQNVQRNLINNINATGDFAARVRTISSTTESFTKALETNKLSMGQYFRYAAGSTKTFGRLFKSEFDTISRVAESRVKTLQTQYIKLGRDAQGAMKAIAVRPLALDMQNLSTQTALAAQKQQLFNQLIKQGSTNLLNFGKNTQWAGRQLMVGFSIPLAYLGTIASKTFMKMEEQAIRFKRVYGDTFTATAETDKMIKQVQQLANEFTKYGVEVEKTMEMAADAAAMGKVGADLLAQVNQATRLAVLGGVEQQEALETTISLTSAFGTAAEDLAGKINFLNAVENQTVTSIEDLTIAIPKAAPVVKQLGGDVEDLAFFLTAMKEGGINASEGANALKSGLAALINPTAKASEFMKGFGINVEGIVESNIGDVKGLVVDFASALDDLDPLNRARAIEQLFGKFQFSRLSTLFQNVIKEGTQAERVLKLSRQTSEELAILSERELKRVEDSPMYKFQKAIEDLKVSLVPLGEAFLKAITPLAEFAKGFLDKFNSMSDEAKNFAVIATTVVAGIGPVLLMTFGLIANGVANLIKMFAFFGNAMRGGAKGANDLSQSTEYMTQQQLEAAAVAASLNQAHSQLVQTFGVESAAVDKLATSYARAIVNQSKLLGINPETGMPLAAGNRAPRPKKYNSGVVSVPGPKGKGDIVPAMLAPGEAVIPADMAKKHRGFIADMINDRLPGYRFGLNPFAAMLGNSRVTTRMKSQTLQDMLQKGDTRYRSAFETGTGDDYLDRISGRPKIKQQFMRTDMEQIIMGIPRNAPASSRPTYGSVELTPMGRMISRLFGLSGKQFSNIAKPGNKYLDIYGDTELVGKKSLNKRSSIFAGDLLRSFDGGGAYYRPQRNKMGPEGSMLPPMRNTSKEQLEEQFSKFRHPFGKSIPGEKSPSGGQYFTSNPGFPYVEAQVAGGFDLKEISKIRVPSRSEARQIQKLVDQAGLRIRVTPQNASPIVKMLANMFGTRFEDGTAGVHRSHLQKILNPLDPEVASQISKKLPGYYNMPEDIRSRMFFSGSLTADLSESMNQSLRGGKLLASDFEDRWNGSQNKLLSTSMKALGRQQLSPAEIKAIASLEEKIGKEAVSLARGGYVTDSVLADATRKVLLKSKDMVGPQGSLANGLLGRSTTLGDYRTNYTKKELQGLLDSGRAVVKGSAIIEPNSGLYLGRMSGSRGPKQVTRHISGGYNNQIKLGIPGRQSLTATPKPASKTPRTSKPLPVAAPQGTQSATSLGNIVQAGARFASPVAATRAGMLGKLFGRKYADGVVSVPGPKGKGDVVPAMLAPGEAVIPTKMAEKYAPLISGMVNDSLPGYKFGKLGAAADAISGFSAKSASIIGKSMGQAIGKSKELGKSFAGALDNSPTLARMASKLSGGANDVVTTSGQTFRNGIEVRTDKSGKEYFVQPGKGRISREAAMSQMVAPEPKQRGRVAGRVGGAASVAGMAAMAYSMTGGPGADIAGMASMPLMMAPMIMPLLSNPIGLTVLALGAVGAVAWKLQEDLNNVRKEAATTAKAFSSGADAMQSLAEFAGTISPTETMNRIRESNRAGYDIVSGKTTFGGQFLQSEAGQNLLKQAETSKLTVGGADSARLMAIQLSQAVASNVLTPGQAASIADNLGEALNDYDFAVDVQAKMIELLGPGGEDLTKDPLTVFANIVTERRDVVADTGGAKDLINEVKGMFFDGRQNYTEVAAAEVEVSQMISDIADMNQQNLDNLELEHMRRLDSLEAAGDLAGIEKENTKYAQDRAKLLADGSAQLKEEIAYLDSLEFSGDNVLRRSAEQIVDNMENSLESLFDGFDAKTKEVNQLAIRNISDNPELTFGEKASILAVMSVENIDLFKEVQQMYPVKEGDNEEVWKKIAQISVEMGSGTTEDMLSIIKGFTSETKAKQFMDYVVNLKTSGDVAGADNAIQTMTELNKIRLESGDAVPLDQFIDDKGNVTEKFSKIITALDELDAAFKNAKGKSITYEILTKTTGIELSKQAQAYFDSLSPDQQKRYVTAYLTIKESIDLNTAEGKARIQAWKNEKILAGGGSGNSTIASYYSGMSLSDAANAMAEEAAEQRSEQQRLDEDDPNPDPKPNNTGGQEKVDPYKDILNRLKQIRNAAIDAGGGLKALKAAMAKGSATTTKFLGTDQKLLFAGYSREFIDSINSMDEETKKKFVSIKNGIVTVTNAGKLLNKAMAEIRIGDFQFSLASGVSTINNQISAMDKLTKNGFSVADAFEIVQDESLAYALATNATTAEVKNLSTWFGRLKDKQKELQLSTPEGTQQWLSDYAGALTSATSKVAEYFAAQKAIVEQDFASGENKSKRNSQLVNIEKISDALEDARTDILDYQDNLDDLEFDLSTIEDKEESVNKKYDERLDALNKIWEANSDIEQQQRAQLDIAQALASGDISAAARAMQEEQRRRAQKAREDQEKAIESARESELEQLRSKSGKTRAQLEAEITELNKKIVTIEEDRLEPNERLLRLAEAQKQLALEAVGEDGYLGQTEEAWGKIENAARLAVVQSDAFRESLKKILDVIPGFSIDEKGNVLFDEKSFAAGIPQPGASSGSVTAPDAGAATTEPLAGPELNTKNSSFAVVANAKSGLYGQTPAPVASNAGVINRDIAEAAAKAAVRGTGITAGGVTIKASSTADFAKQVMDTVLSNRAAVNSGDLSAAEKKKLTEQNIDLMKTTGLRFATGGMVPKYFAAGGFARGTDTVPAMLTSGEFVMSRYAVSKYGVEKMKAINTGSYKNDSVYNYSVNVNVKSDANPDEIASSVMTRIKQIDSQRIRSNRY